MPDINITVANKVAVSDTQSIVCDNSDYMVRWTLDAEWSAYDTKTMRTIYMDGTFEDKVFSGDVIALPVCTVPGAVQIGLFAGDIRTSRVAILRALQSVRSGAGAPADPTPDVYDQLMELIKGLGVVDPDDISKAVADYLAAHPIEETDPTVPAWAKAETKPTYSAAEVGAISQSDLQAATDAALAQAKASGEFDGPRGPAGAPGKDGTAGADGVTPTIGDNGNWYIGSTDTGKPSRGATGAKGSDGAQGEKGDTGPAGPQGPAGAPGKDGAGMDITGATVGQIAKIAAVDESGAPTAWEPVDMPGAGGAWEKIIDTEVMEATPSFTCNGLNCNEIYIRWSKLENATNMNSSLDLYLNNTLIMSSAIIVNKSGGGVYGWTLCRNNRIVWATERSDGAISESNLRQGIVYVPYNLISGVGTATTLKLDTPNSAYAPITGKLEVWVR